MEKDPFRSNWSINYWHQTPRLQFFDIAAPELVEGSTLSKNESTKHWKHHVVQGGYGMRLSVCACAGVHRGRHGERLSEAPCQVAAEQRWPDVGLSTKHK